MNVEDDDEKTSLYKEDLQYTESLDPTLKLSVDDRKSIVDDLEGEDDDQSAHATPYGAGQ